MSWMGWAKPRTVVLLLLWVLPILLYVVLGIVALVQTGWLVTIAWILPVMWFFAWSVGKLWKPAGFAKSSVGKPLKAPDFWTPADTAALVVVEEFRSQVAEVNSLTIVDADRYIQDARTLAEQLAKHYRTRASKHAMHTLTIVEIFAVIHLAVEDMEAWLLENVPGSQLATVGQIERIPAIAKMLDIGQSIFFIASTLTNPMKLLAYPLWRKSGSVTVELQNEVVRRFYQSYLKHVGFYLIEMYSGRLQGGSQMYRQRFGKMSQAVHIAKGNSNEIEVNQATDTTIAVMGQVKAGKSSLINALMRERVAVTSILPETRQVQRFQFQLPDAPQTITLLDSPGYQEADVSKQQRREVHLATESADIVLLVMAANSPARDADVKLVKDLTEHYRKRTHLSPPPIIAVLTHMDRLRPWGEWSPPYDWRHPRSAKEHSIADAVAYIHEIFGSALSGVACVVTGDAHEDDTSVADELIPIMAEHLDAGHATAILKAFYQQLSRQRLQNVMQQFSGLIESLGRKLLEP